MLCTAQYSASFLSLSLCRYSASANVVGNKRSSFLLLFPLIAPPLPPSFPSSTYENLQRDPAMYEALLSSYEQHFRACKAID